MSEMKRLLPPIAFLCMTLPTDLFAQNGIKFKSRIVGELHPGVAGAVTGITGERLIVAGGADFPDRMPWEGGVKTYHDKVHILQKKGDRLVETPVAAALPEKVAYVAACTTPQGVFYAGGENASGLTDKAWLCRWNDTTGSLTFDALPALPIALTNASAAYCDRRVYLAGGESKQGPTDQCWTLDLGDPEGGWSPLPSLPKPVTHAVLTAVEVQYAIVLHVYGGRCRKPDGISEIYDSVFELSPSEGRWVSRPSLPYPVSAHSGAAFGTSGALLFGGDRGTTFSKVERMLAAIAQSKDEAERQRLIREKNDLLARHPGFNADVLYYDHASGKSVTIGKMTGKPPVTATALEWNGSYYIPSGEIRAGVRTPTILRIDVATKKK